MEDVIVGFVSSHVSLDEADVSLIHPRYCQYKIKSLVSSQEKRRNEWLQLQKEKRLDLLNLQRGISENDFEDDGMEVDAKEKSKKISYDECDLQTISSKLLGYRWKEFSCLSSTNCCSRRQEARDLKFYKREYKGFLMLSEWLIAVPDDMDENWLCAICPEGKRALVVATKGKTSAYARNGECICSSFPSWLPGGSRLTNRGKTMLDTVFDPSTSTFYILDMIHWAIDSVGFEAEMRFYWIATKISEEIPQIKEQCKTNKYKFITLEYFSFPQLAEKMSVHPVFDGNSPKVDGILFFHKKGYYVHTRSPLVTWLKPFMVPDILGIPVAPQYLLEKPANYPKMETEESKCT